MLFLSLRGQSTSPAPSSSLASPDKNTPQLVHLCSGSRIKQGRRFQLTCAITSLTAAPAMFTLRAEDDIIENHLLLKGVAIQRQPWIKLNPLIVGLCSKRRRTESVRKRASGQYGQCTISMLYCRYAVSEALKEPQESYFHTGLNMSTTFVLENRYINEHLP